MLKKAACWLGACLASALCATLAQAGDPPLPPALKAQVQKILQASSGGSAAVLLVDGLGVSGAYQHGDLHATACGTAGGAGDAVVALVAMRLAERDKVDLYLPLPAQLPALLQVRASMLCQKKSAGQSTLSQLLEHSSGMATATAALDSCPGSRTVYSSSGIRAATRVLEKTSKTSITVLMQREVFGPLVMPSSRWGFAQARCAGSMSDETQGLITTPSDLANLVQMLVLRGQVNAKTYLPQCAVERMGLSVSAVSMPGGNTPAAIAQAAYGLGLQRFKSGGQVWLGFAANPGSGSGGDRAGEQWVWGYSSQSQNGMVIATRGLDAKALAAIKSAVAAHLSQGVALVSMN